MWNQFITCGESQMLLQKQSTHVLQMCYFKDSKNRKIKGYTDIFQMQLDVFFNVSFIFLSKKSPERDFK